ncbi:hypothetical protein ACIQBJ_32115 [Kitasatospora sp. NPDC088391]|uniref:hypothetical protein n=1 Tax=Kitasatospora sp. NPDC088391 TaxID=3364074 RepID=UPI00381F8181
MSNEFKKQVGERKSFAPRQAIPQVDPEAPKTAPAEPVEPPQPTTPAAPVEADSSGPVIRTIVDTNESPLNRGFHMYPSRHKQVTHDLVYIEERKPWEIIEDALEEYVVKHYGKQYKRK